MPRIVMLLLLLLLMIMMGVANAQYAPLLEDNVIIRTDIQGLTTVNPRSWMDSYSDGNSCYCNSTFDHNMDVVYVDTPLGNMSIPAICKLLGNGPRGSVGRPRYNDIQCGNGPSAITSTRDEFLCPGRIEYGQEGCKYIGPKWNFTKFVQVVPTGAPIAVNVPTQAPVLQTTRRPIIPTTTTTTKVPATRRPTTKAPVVGSSPNTRRPTTKAPVIVSSPSTRRPTTKVPVTRTPSTNAPNPVPTTIISIPITITSPGTTIAPTIISSISIFRTILNWFNSTILQPIFSIFR